jgi:hypothetical protein
MIRVLQEPCIVEVQGFSARLVTMLMIAWSLWGEAAFIKHEQPSLSLVISQVRAEPCLTAVVTITVTSTLNHTIVYDFITKDVLLQSPGIVCLPSH